MKTTFFLLAFLVASINGLAQKTFQYPVAPKDEVIDDYHGTKIADPYRWMENPEDPRLKEWLKVQKSIVNKEDRKQRQKFILSNQMYSMFNAVTKQRLDTQFLSPQEYVKRKKLLKIKYSSYDRADILYYRNQSHTNFKKLVKANAFRNNRKDKVLIKEAKLNDDNNVVAISISHSSSDWREVYFFDINTGDQLSDTLKYLRIGSEIEWDGDGVYYDAYKKPEEGRELLDNATGQTLFYHKLGTQQDEDIKLYHNPDKSGKDRFSYSRIDSTRFLFFHKYYPKGKIYNAISYAYLNKQKPIFLTNFLVYESNDSLKFECETICGDTVLLKTNLNAPNGKVVSMNIHQKNKLTDLVAEYDMELKEVNSLGKDKFACIYKRGGQNQVLIFNSSGRLLKKIEFPIGKKVNHFYEDNLKAEYVDFSLSSFYHPELWFRLSLKDFAYKPILALSVPYDPADIETRYVKYTSKDGTEIPMYITCLKRTKLNGENPTLMYGYGGYGTTVEPEYDRFKTLWILHGGILAVPNVRGGGAEGDHWGKNGRRLKKQNAIDDFLAAAEYLIEDKYTNSDKLAINGASHGGMLVTAAMVQRPSLFKAVIAEAGVMDMLRFGKYTIGGRTLNIKEFGTVEDQQDFVNMLSYSPLQNLKKGIKYPSLLLITGDKDDRVPPFHSYKFLAKIQANGSNKSLYHMYLNESAGHFGAATPIERGNQMLYKYYFLFDQLGLKF